MMTVFLCIMAYLAIASPPHVVNDGQEGSTVPAYAVWVILVLGITAMALWSYLA